MATAASDETSLAATVTASEPSAVLWCFGAGTSGQLGSGGLFDSAAALPLRLPPTKSPYRYAPNPRTASTSACSKGTSSSTSSKDAATAPPLPPHCAAAARVLIACGGNHAVAWRPLWPGDEAAAGEGCSPPAPPGARAHGAARSEEAAGGPVSSDLWIWTWGDDVAGVGDSCGAAGAEELPMPPGLPGPPQAPSSANTQETVAGIATATACIASDIASAAGASAAAAPVATAWRAADDVRVLPSPRRLILPAQVRQIACGWEHTVFRTACGRVLVAGRGERGQLGLGQHVTAAPRPRLLLLPSALLPPGWLVTSVAAGLWHTLLAAAPAVAAATHAAATRSGDDVAADDDGDDDAARMAGCDPRVAVPSAAAVYGFGSNRRLQLGLAGDAAEEPSSTGVKGCDQTPQGKAAPGGGGGGSGARDGGSRISGPRRRRGTSSIPANAWSPVLVHRFEGPMAAPPLQVYGGGDRSACVDAAGRLYAWGRGLAAAVDCGSPEQVRVPAVRLRTPQTAPESLQLPPPSPPRPQQQRYARSSAPAPATWSAVQSLAAAEAAASKGGAVVAPDAAPVWRQVALGWHHVVGLDSRGGVWAWGANKNGQLARQPPTPPPPRPRLDPVRSAAAPPFSESTPASMTAAAEEEEVGASAVPLRVPLPGPGVCVSTGSEHCAAVLYDGSVFTWGWGEHGQLGHGDTRTRWVPQPVTLRSYLPYSDTTNPIEAGGDGERDRHSSSGIGGGEGRVGDCLPAGSGGKHGPSKLLRCYTVACGAGFTVCA